MLSATFLASIQRPAIHGKGTQYVWLDGCPYGIKIRPEDKAICIAIAQADVFRILSKKRE
ncbi:hypothetical protein BK653_27880 [Pseudomonas brassicacearum]|nr:hypothetical protein BK653_27880 [Pseudomonas brassicacearum]